MYLVTFGDEEVLDLVKSGRPSIVTETSILCDDDVGEEYSLKRNKQFKGELILVVDTFGENRKKIVKKEEFSCEIADYITDNYYTNIEPCFGEVGVDDPTCKWIIRSREYLDVTISTFFSETITSYKHSMDISSNFYASVIFPIREVLYNKAYQSEVNETNEFKLNMGYSKRNIKIKKESHPNGPDTKETFHENFDIDSDSCVIGESVINLYEKYMGDRFFDP